MNKNRIAESVAIATGFVFLIAPALVHAQNAMPSVAHPPTVASHGPQAKSDSAPPDDFAGVNYSDTQKAQIDKIHRETESHKAVVAQDQKLNADQKNAMLVGYTRMEYGQVYRVLTPEQQRTVRQRMAARRQADMAAQRKVPPAAR